ncbi:zf-HC2 domain-containing protein [Solibacillus sp. MA9]|uniref:Zf-HC2 domain-containing protein n=1 Tax=Solibacillus palustris TaxID=2908203 RepID=A0ABS9U7M8_9BACL|nr:zf-HC2 domain-containing protein [Solibacillus sp. MA9]MCH7320327.1 zf-HC2 domain-containing protein [Solibacillus sp. MA9]
MNACKFVEDLLPLYEENLVQPETKEWIEQHLSSCTKCQKLTSNVMEALPQLTPPKKSATTMMQHVQLKLTIYQLLFVVLSFVFAMNTSLLNESFAFILSYFILGAITFYFYRQALLTLLLAFLPIFIWSIYATISSYGTYSKWYVEQITHYSSTLSLITSTVLGGILTAFIHTLFTLLGIIVVKLLIQAFKKEDAT